MSQTSPLYPLSLILSPMTFPTSQESAEPSEEIADSPEAAKDEGQRTKDELGDSPFLKACRREPPRSRRSG